MNFPPRGSLPWVIGHRGSKTLHLENSLAAIEHAAACGADGVEIDVRSCKDDRLVVFHDATLERMSADGDRRRVCDMTLAEVKAAELRGGYKIPTLEQVLACRARLGIRLNVELKHDVPQRLHMAQRCARMLQAEPTDSLLVSSFDPFLLSAFQKLCPRIKTGILLDKVGLGRRLARWAPLFPADAVCAHFSLIDAQRVHRWLKGGKAVVAWTVNAREEQRRLEGLGIQAIICDAPCELVQARREGNGITSVQQNS